MIKQATRLVCDNITKVGHEIEDVQTEIGKLEGVEKAQSDILETIRIIEAEIKSHNDKLEEALSKRVQANHLKTTRLDEYINATKILTDWEKLYEEMIDKFASGKTEIMSGIDFESSIYFNRIDFIETGLEILDNRMVSTPDIERIADILQSAITKESSEELVATIKQYVDASLSNKTNLKSRRAISDLYKWVFDSYMTVTTNIYFNQVPMNKLSMGQKGTVLLKLFLAEGDYPIIVDQPEENLDNMFIYDELVDAFRQAKTNRQLIIATNNANLVVNTDAEQIIIAEYTDNTISYKIGAIEDQSIKKDITTILEGGEEALKKREKKYGM